MKLNQQPINAGRISQIKNGEIGKDIKEASDQDINEFFDAIKNDVGISFIIKQRILNSRYKEKGKYYLNLAENYQIELKEGMNLRNNRFDDEIIRVLQSFANNEGGCVIFGVSDRTKEVVGVNKNKAMQIDLRFTNERIKYCMNKVPALHLEIIEFNNDVSILILCVDKSKNKPIMFTKNENNKIKDGFIYFRYNAETRLIGSSELENIISERCRNNIMLFAKNYYKIIDIENLNGTQDKVDGVKAFISEDGEGVKVKLTDDKILEKYPLSHNELVNELKNRYENFKQNKEFHKIMREKVKKNKRYSFERCLDPRGSKTKKYFYSPSVIYEIFDEIYTIKK